MTIRTVLIALSLALGASPCPAGLVMRLQLEHPAVLQFERLDATLSIQNNAQTAFSTASGENKSGGVLRFVIEKERFEPLEKVGEGPMTGKIVIDPDKSETITLDLSLWYVMRKPGRYLVRAEIDWRGETYKSNSVMVDVVRGLEVASVQKSVPGQESKVRTYALRYWSRGRGEHLFLCVEDENQGINYGVFRLGPIIRLKKPVLKVDSMGYVVVVHQSGPDQFTRSGLLSSRAGVTFIGQVQEREDGSPYPVRPAPIRMPNAAGADDKP